MIFGLKSPKLEWSFILPGKVRKMIDIWKVFCWQIPAFFAFSWRGVRYI
jgi:hypothetical protein